MQFGMQPIISLEFPGIVTDPDAVQVIEIGNTAAALTLTELSGVSYYVVCSNGGQILAGPGGFDPDPATSKGLIISYGGMFKISPYQLKLMRFINENAAQPGKLVVIPMTL